MATKEAVTKGLEKIKAKVEDRDVQNAFQDVNNSAYNFFILTFISRTS